MARNMRHFTDLLIEDYANELVNQWVELNIEPWRFNFLAKNWKCPKSDENREILPAAQWEKEKEAFLACGKDVEVFDEAEVCATYYSNYGKNYLVWLEFWGQDGKQHTIDAWINENGKNVRNAEKFIDPRSPECEAVYNSIINTGYIPVETAQLLLKIGSENWDGTVEQKTQKKLNSWKQEHIFESAVEALKAMNIKVDLVKLDKFGDYLYRGNPGNIADYDLTFISKKGVKYTARIDLKLLEDFNTAKKQIAHDAELLILSNWRTAEVSYYRVFENKDSENIEDYEDFIILLDIFKQKLIATGSCFIHINKIDLETGKVNFALFGNNAR